MVNTISQITHIHLKDFRCFKERIITCDAPIVLIQGSNGVGKTSLLEALYYSCYLRSFRTPTSKELIAEKAPSFFINVTMRVDGHTNDIAIGFSPEKRLVKVNHQVVSSYKELLSCYRIIVITEDDLDLIKEGPAYRRDFLDQTLMLLDVSYVAAFKKMRDTLEKRNIFLQSGASPFDMYLIWSQQLWDRSFVLQTKRKQLIERVQLEVHYLIQHYFDDMYEVHFSYQSKNNELEHTFEEFHLKYPTLYQDEQRFKRSLFGAHLDDMIVTFKGKKSRLYASRGQQKLLVILIKAAQIRLLNQASCNSPVILLLDDFMTDFDQKTILLLLTLLKDLGVQLIFTIPIDGFIQQELLKMGATSVKLDSIDPSVSF